MKNFINITILTLIISSFLWGEFYVGEIRVEPEFVRPGEEITVFVEINKPRESNNHNPTGLKIGGVISSNSSWDEKSYLFWYRDGDNSEAIKLSSDLEDEKEVILLKGNEIQTGWHEISFKTIVPKETYNNDSIYVILRIIESSANWDPDQSIASLTKPSHPIFTPVETYSKFEVSSNKYAIYNTAYTQVKSSRARLVIVDGKKAMVTLEANPSENPYYVFDKSTQDITLTSSIEEAKVSYKVTYDDGREEEGKFNGSKEITINGSAQVKAWVEESDAWRAASETWEYKQELKPATLIADPGSKSPDKPYEYDVSEMRVRLETSPGATIYYSLYSRGEDKNDLKRTIYEGGELTVRGDDTIWIRAKGGDWGPLDTVLTYHSNLPTPNLNANPSHHEEFLFGYTLSIELESDADWIRYGKNDSENFNEYKRQIEISAEDPDTVKIYAEAGGVDFQDVRKSWVYIRDTLPAPEATESDETQFTGELQVTFRFPDGIDSRWEDLEIYYTLDGSEPTRESGTLYKNRINISETTNLRARAFSSNRVSSPIASWNYRKANSVKRAWYKDISGDGAIDYAQIELNSPLTEKPERVVLWSPFDTLEKLIFEPSEIELDRDIIKIYFSEPFNFKNKTSFEKEGYGFIDGKYFLPQTELILADSVAPILISADYKFGSIREESIKSGRVERERDTLTVQFSEIVSIPSFKKPLEFFRDGMPYRVEFSESRSSIEKDRATLVVSNIFDVNVAQNGDSLSIATDREYVIGAVAQLNPKNRPIPLRVHPAPIFITIDAISPVDPEHYEIPTDLRGEHWRLETGMVVVADFHSLVDQSSDIRARATIFDQLGNEVASSRRNRSSGLSWEINEKLGKTMILFYWDGRNSNKRLTGSGKYSMHISIELPDGNSISRVLPIGLSIDREERFTQ